MVKYVSLKKIYYTDAKNLANVYQARFHAPETKHFAIDIKQYHRKNSYGAFLCYTEEIILLIEKIYNRLRDLSKIKDGIPFILLRQFLLSGLIDEVQSTNDIEGVRSTKKQIRDVLENQPVSKEFLHLKSVVDKYNKIINGNDIKFFTCKDIRSFYDTFALDEVISEHPDWKPDGLLFRKDMVEITTPTGKTVHQGIYPEERLIASMETALSLLNNTDVPFLVRVAVFHYFFGYIHPFYDGNGRTSRFISSYYLAKEFDVIVALRLAVVIKKNKNKYYKIFEDTDSEYNRGDLTVFVYSFLEMIYSAINESVEILTRKKQQLEMYSAKLDNMDLGDKVTKNIYYILLQASLFYGEGATIQQLMKTMGKSRGTIQQRIDKIPNKYLIINKISKPYRYRLNMMMFK